MLSHDIEADAKKKVKNGGKNPGPANYQNDKCWIKSSQLFASEKYSVSKDMRASYMDQPANWVIEYPSPNKYEKVPFDKYANKVYEAKIHNTHLPRFKPTQKNNVPSPATYKVHDAVENS